MFLFWSSVLIMLMFTLGLFCSLRRQSMIMLQCTRNGAMLRQI